MTLSRLCFSLADNDPDRPQHQLKYNNQINNGDRGATYRSSSSHRSHRYSPRFAAPRSGLIFARRMSAENGIGGSTDLHTPISGRNIPARNSWVALDWNAESPVLSGSGTAAPSCPRRRGLGSLHSASWPCRTPSPAASPQSADPQRSMLFEAPRDRRQA